MSEEGGSLFSQPGKPEFMNAGSNWRSSSWRPDEARAGEEFKAIQESGGRPLLART